MSVFDVAFAGPLLVLCAGLGLAGCEKVNPDFDEASEDGSTGSASTTGVGTTTGSETADAGSVGSESSVTSTTTTSDPTTSTSDPPTSTTDTSDPDPCNADGDCAAPTPLCGPQGCQSGDEGDPCEDVSDCAGTASICSSDEVCQDGGDGDACNVKSDCASGLMCATSCTACTAISDVDVVADITHTWIGDHVIKLVGPDSSVETLVSIAGGNEMSDGGDLSPGALGSAANIDGAVTFDNDAEVSSELMGDGLEDDQVICVDSEPCAFYSTGFEDTEFNLTDFNGQPAAGDWMLCFGDHFLGDTLFLNAWQLVVTCDEGTVTLDSGSLNVAVPDDTYDGTVESMTCHTLTF